MEGDTLLRDSSPGWLRKGVESSLRFLGTDYAADYASGARVLKGK